MMKNNNYNESKIIFTISITWIIVLIIGINIINKLNNVTTAIDGIEPTAVITDTVYVHDALSDPKKDFRRALDTFGVHHADYVYAQAILESGNFSAKNAIEANNYLGLMSNSGRLMKFNHWTECISYYSRCISPKYKEGEDYPSFLRRVHYYEDKSYDAKLNAVYKQVTKK